MYAAEKKRNVGELYNCRYKLTGTFSLRVDEKPLYTIMIFIIVIVANYSKTAYCSNKGDVKPTTFLLHEQ